MQKSKKTSKRRKRVQTKDDSHPYGFPRISSLGVGQAMVYAPGALQSHVINPVYFVFCAKI